MKKRGVVLLWLLWIPSCVLLPTDGFREVPLPRLESPLVIEVARVVNPRFPSLSLQQFQRALKQARILIKQHFQVDVLFRYQQTISIKQFFDYLSPSLKQLKQHEMIHFRDGIDKKELALMVRSIEVSLKKMSRDLGALYRFAEPYLTSKAEGSASYHNLSVALAKTLKERLQEWQKLQASDGDSVINNDFYNEWVYWDNIGYSMMPYDLVITNQLVASVEKYGMDIHSALRGGISNGTTSFAYHTRYGSYSFVSSFPLLNNYPVIRLLRNQRILSEAQQSHYLAAMITHELGHQLFHYGHPYGKQECIMSPMPLIDYQSWLAAFDAEKCRQGNYPAMQAGSALLVYEPELLPVR